MEKRNNKFDTEKDNLNRKLIVWVFIATGIISLFFWWKGRKSFADISPFTATYESKNDELPAPTKFISKYEVIKSELEKLVATESGTYAVYVKNLTTNDGFDINGSEIMDGASIMKVPAMITALRQIDNGKWTSDDEFELKEIDRTTGSGPLQFVKAGTMVSLERILNEMGKKSDNTGWVMLNRLLGMKAIESEIEKMGMNNTDYRELTTSAIDVGKMWEIMYNSEEWTKFRGYLSDSIYEDRIPLGIKDEGVEIVHKVGTLDGVWADSGIIECSMSNVKCLIEPKIIVILNKGVKRDEAVKMVPELTKRIWEFENK